MAVYIRRRTALRRSASVSKNPKLRSHASPHSELAGLPWGFSVDTFAVGCIIAELYLSRELLPRDIDTDREHLAILEKTLGPFPEVYARDLEQTCAGTFTFGSQGASVVFPPGVSTESMKTYESNLKRLENMMPLSVCLLSSSIDDLSES